MLSQTQLEEPPEILQPWSIANTSKSITYHLIYSHSFYLQLVLMVVNGNTSLLCAGFMDVIFMTSIKYH